MPRESRLDHGTPATRHANRSPTRKKHTIALY
jgi:hypothetical protein